MFHALPLGALCHMVTLPYPTTILLKRPCSLESQEASLKECRPPASATPTEVQLCSIEPLNAEPSSTGVQGHWHSCSHLPAAAC